MSDPSSSTSQTIAMPGRFRRIVTNAISFGLARLGWMLLRLFFRVEIKELHHIPSKGPVLIVSNHPSYIEPIVFVGMGKMYLGRPVAFMAWDKLFRIPGVGAILRAFGAYPVDLANPGRKPYERLLRILRDGGIAGVFPEGQRSTGPLMGEWKPGALRAALSTDPTIVPITVIGAGEIWPIGQTFPRLFKRVTVHIHPGRKLDTMGHGPLPSGSAKDWLRSIEDQIREEINTVLLDSALRSKDQRITRYRMARPPVQHSFKSKFLESHKS